MDKHPNNLADNLKPLQNSLKKIGDAMKSRPQYIHHIDVSSEGKTNFDKNKTLHRMVMGDTISFIIQEINPKTMQACRDIVNDLKQTKIIGGVLSKITDFVFDFNIPDGYANNEQVAEISKLDKVLEGCLRTRIYDSKVPLRTKMPAKYEMLTVNNKQWSFSQVINSNRKINDVVEKIQNHKNTDGSELSPYEKYLAAYSWVASFSYNQGNEWHNIKTPLGVKKLKNPFMSDISHSLSRDPIKVLDSDKIVCVGYAMLLAKVCEQLGITCMEQFCEIKDIKWKAPKEKDAEPDKEIAEKGEHHLNNLVYLNDPKYKIDGIFYADACWDSKKKNGNRSIYAIHAMPYDQVPKMLRRYVDGLDFPALRDGKLSPYSNQRIAQFIINFDPQEFQKISRPNSIPLTDTHKALRNALTCDTGQVNSLENLDEVMTSTMVTQQLEFQTMGDYWKNEWQKLVSAQGSEQGK